MSSNQEFRPNWASAPGDTISDILRERNLTESEFARQLGRPLEDARNLLQGRSTITLAIARRLERALGSSVEFWMARDFQYRESVARLRADHEEWLAGLPVGDIIRFGWIKPVPHPADEVNACLRFFDMPSVGAWREAYADLQQMVAYRTSPSLDSRPGAVAAWLRQGEIEANAITCDPWNADRLQEALPLIRALTREKDPQQFVPELQKICAACGVAVAIVRAPSGCRASGATRFLTSGKALLMLSFRYLTDDHFWFTFFHEVGHLLLHDKRRFFLEGLDAISVTEEEEANNFSANCLVPSEFRSEMLSLPPHAREVMRFARRVGVAPGIVVGQLQHYKRIRHNQLNRLKRRYQWES